MLKIRLRRQGSHKRPFYRVVVSDQRKRPEGRVVAEIGYYDPMKTPKVLDIDLGRWDEWLAKGAQPSETIAALVKKQRAQEKSEAAATVSA